MKREFTFCQQLERDLLTAYRERLWQPFCRAVRLYRLIQPGDRIAVCISGGKDSMLLAKLMQLLHRHTAYPFEVRYLVMDPGYSPANRQKIEDNARLLEIPCTIFDSDVFDVACAQEKNPCFLCARMRRGCLYGKARELGCNKIALGHHFDDVIETVLISMFYGGQIQGMPPRLKSKNFPGMELIRPLYRVREEDIITWKEQNGLEFLQCACRFTENAARAGREGDSKRQQIKRLLKQLRQDNPVLEQNIFGALHNVQLDTLVAWEYRGKAHSFLDAFSPSGEEEPDGNP